MCTELNGDRLFEILSPRKVWFDETPSPGATEKIIPAQFQRLVLPHGTHDASPAWLLSALAS